VTSHKEPHAFYAFRGRAPIQIGQAGRRTVDPVTKKPPEMTFYQRSNYRLSADHHQVASQDYAPTLFGMLIFNLIDSLTVEDVESLFGFRRPTPTIRELDRISLGDFLLKGLQKSNVFGSAYDARELIGSTTGLAVWWDKALGMFLRDELTATGDGLEEIAGGMDQLPTALSKAFAKLPHGSGRIRLATQILAIDRSEQLNRDRPDEKIRITFAKLAYGEGEAVSEAKPPLPDLGQAEQLDFDHVICTIPFPVLRNVGLSGISPEKRRAIRNLNYASSSKVLLYCKERFWESPKYGIVGGASLSDQITRATYYPSDQLSRHLAGKSLPIDRQGRFRSQFTTTPPPESMQRQIMNLRVARDDADSLSKNPGVLVASYNWGRDARAMGALTKARRAEVCREVITVFHPELRPPRNCEERKHDIVLDYDSIFWDQHPWSRAAFCFMNPGDLEQYYSDAIRSEGHLHFAGEHCSLDQGWIQGALISGLRAVEGVVSSI
jgi:monoamine oxidase